MSDGVYFDGDPATDSARRHMERVLKGEPTRRWPWIVAALGSGTVWMLWRAGQTAAGRRDPGGTAPQDAPQTKATQPPKKP